MKPFSEGKPGSQGKDDTFRTGWWFQICFYFHLYLGKIPILTNIFSNGLKPQTREALQVVFSLYLLIYIYIERDYIFIYICNVALQG